MGNATKGNGAQPSFLELLEKAGPDDLAQIDIEIASCETRLASLQAARRVLDVKVNGPKPKGGRKAGGVNRDPKIKELRLKACEYLLHSGPTKPIVLGQQISCPPDLVPQMLKYSYWFEHRDGLVRLTENGKRMAEENK